MEIEDIYNMNFDDFCNFNNIIINLNDELPTKIKGMCIHVDEYYKIIINSKNATNIQKNTLLHEIAHILKDHFSFDCTLTAEECENEVNNLIDKFKFEIGSCFDLSIF